MFNMTAKDLLAVYEQLKGRYRLTMTTTAALNEGFTVDCPIIVGKAHGQIMELYKDGSYFVLDIMDEAQTKGTHWHPGNAEAATNDIVAFMEGKSHYELTPFNQI